MNRNRVAVVLTVSVACFLAGRSVIAQPIEKVLNWSAPPYWMPNRSAAVPNPPGEKATISSDDIAGSAGSRVSPEAIEAVPTAPLAFTGISPCRVADTRGNGFAGQYGPPQITPAGRTITIANVCGIPAAAQAVSFNFSAVNVPGAGFLVAYPAGAAFPASATMTYNQNTPNLSNAAVVPLGTGGAITVVAGVVSIDLVIDVNGYYAPQTVVNTVNNLSGAVTLAPGSNVSITPSGQTLTIAAVAASAWSLTGNTGTTPGTNFLGTTDIQALELKVGNLRALRLEPTGSGPNVIGGYSGNSATVGTASATISGGGSFANLNQVTDSFGTVGGGYANRAGDNAGTVSDRTGATVCGGLGNVASGVRSSIGGGESNIAGGPYAAIGGGANNQASAQAATVGGGTLNHATVSNTTVAGGTANVAAADGATIGGGELNSASGALGTVSGGTNNAASGYGAAIPGGTSNTAAGTYSLAAGNRARANHDGSFVWGDTTSADVSSTAENQFIVRAAGGMWLGTTSAPSFTAGRFINTSTGGYLSSAGAWTNSSDARLKEDFTPVDGMDLLGRLAQLPVTSWRYKAERADVRHIGPTAQDFRAAFGLGSDEISISTIDPAGVALAAIQGLYELVRQKDGEIEALKARLAKVEERIQ